MATGVVPAGAGQQPHVVEHTIATHLAGGYQVVVSDLNGDGELDIVCIGSVTANLVWFENQG